MHSPPSSPLFPSSPIHRNGDDPQEEVEALLAAALKVKVLDADLAAFLESETNLRIFEDVLSRQVQLLQSRSQAFEDAHITVYDKVLLLLTRNGNNLKSAAAVTWYCTEFLGWIPNGEPVENTRFLENKLVLSHKLSQDPTLRSTRKNCITSTVMHTEDLKSAHELSAIKRDPRFTHLWSVYKKAHAEYLSLADSHDENALEAAKFLRDTAENGVLFLKDKHPRSMLMKEMNDTHDMAKMAVLNLNGGKKRKFDIEARDGQLRAQRIHHFPHTAAHNRANFASRKQTEESKGKKRSRGRGPSGVPYGYSRPVDSYYPV